MLLHAGGCAPGRGPPPLHAKPIATSMQLLSLEAAPGRSRAPSRAPAAPWHCGRSTAQSQRCRLRRVGGREGGREARLAASRRLGTQARRRGGASLQERDGKRRAMLSECRRLYQQTNVQQKQAAAASATAGAAMRNAFSRRGSSPGTGAPPTSTCFSHRCQLRGGKCGCMRGRLSWLYSHWLMGRGVGKAAAGPCCG